MWRSELVGSWGVSGCPIWLPYFRCIARSQVGKLVCQNHWLTTFTSWCMGRGKLERRANSSLLWMRPGCYVLLFPSHWSKPSHLFTSSCKIGWKTVTYQKAAAYPKGRGRRFLMRSVKHPLYSSLFLWRCRTTVKWWNLTDSEFQLKKG